MMMMMGLVPPNPNQILLLLNCPSGWPMIYPPRIWLTPVLFSPGIFLWRRPPPPTHAHPGGLLHYYIYEARGSPDPLLC